jgi:DNA-directed RNA polymerase subunit RPC12/RpoP
MFYVSKKAISQFTSVSAIALLAIGLAFLVSDVSSLHLTEPKDPLFNIPIRLVLLVVAAVFIGVATTCLSLKAAWLQLGLLLWASANFLVYEGVLFYGDQHISLAPYLSCVANAYALSPRVLSAALNLVLICIFAGGLMLSGALWAKNHFLNRISCDKCGGHIAFSSRDEGRSIDCPHCSARVVLTRQQGSIIVKGAKMASGES